MKYKKLLYLLFFAAVFTIPLFDLFHLGLPITHDGQDHVARIANFYRGLKEGIIVPRWAGNLNWGYGHPILMFLYPLSSYMASFFHFLGFSLVDSVKVVFGLSYILSGFAMYLFIKTFLKDEKAAVFGAMLYLFSSYRFVDLYVRGAIGEHVAFIFPPLILYFLLKMVEKPEKKLFLIGAGFSFGALILSHNAITLMFLPLIFLFSIYLIIISKNKFLIAGAFFSSFLIGLGISSFFWIPAFFEGKYTLRDIVIAKNYYLNFVDWPRFFSTNWSFGGSKDLSTQIGVVQWIIVLLSFPGTLLLYKTKNKLWTVIAFLILIFGSSLFLMSEQSQMIWEKISLIQKFQFPWRFLSLTVFITSVLGGLVFAIFPARKKILLLFFFSFFLLVLNKNYWKANGFLNKSSVFYTGVYNGTTDTGESAPIWSVRFMEKRPKAHMETILGDAKIREIERTSVSHVYNIIAENKTRIRENTLYFPGWNVIIDGKMVNIEFQDPNNRGLITFFVEKGKHNVVVEFKETKLRFVSNLISLLTIFLSIFYIILNKKIWRKYL